MQGIERKTFVKPYPLMALNGELGITSKDIASCIGSNLENIHKKIAKDRWTTMEKFKPVPYVSINETNGQKTTCYAFTVRGAKAFVARYSNAVGDQYLDFLFDCEDIVLNRVPELVKKILSLESWKKKTIGKHKFLVRKLAVPVQGLFGKEYEVVEERKYLSEMDHQERRAFNFQHRSRVMEGCAKKNNEEMDDGFIIPTATGNTYLPGEIDYPKDMYFPKK